MKHFTDQEMGELLPSAREYSVVILKRGPRFGDESSPAIIWEHGRRNFGLRDDGVLAVVLPVSRRMSSPTRCTPAGDSPATRCPR